MTRSRGHYVKRVGDAICERIALGDTLLEALDRVGYIAPTPKQFWVWIDSFPEFKQQYDRARELQADFDSDKMRELGRSVINNPKAATAYRVAVDVLKWQAEMHNRRKYGGKAEPALPKVLKPEEIRAEIRKLEAELGLAEKKPPQLKVVGE